MKKVGKLSLMLLVALALTGCSQNQKTKPSPSKSNSTTKVSKKKVTKVGHLKANDLSPQKTVAVVTAYAGKRYAGDWNEALNKAKDNGLEVDLKNQADYDYMKDGSGVAYLVSADASYTLKQVDGENTYYLYGDKKELASVTMKQMIDYLNKRDSDKLVNDLAENAKVVDQRSDSDDDTNTAKKSNLPGDKGLFNVPSALQGTWYTAYGSKLTTIKIEQNKIITDNGNAQELHKIDPAFFKNHEYYQMPKSYQKVTKDWGMAGMLDQRVHGINFMNVRSWMQGAGDGEYFGVHTENGQQVLVIASGAEIWTEAVAWKTPQLAKQYKNKKFKDLYYQDN